MAHAKNSLILKFQYHVSPQQELHLSMFGNNMKHWHRRHKHSCQLFITTCAYCKVNVLNHTYHMYTRASYSWSSLVYFRHTQTYHICSYLQADPQYQITQQYRLVSSLKQNCSYLFFFSNSITEKKRRQNHPFWNTYTTFKVKTTHNVTPTNLLQERCN